MTSCTIALNVAIVPPKAITPALGGTFLHRTLSNLYMQPLEHTGANRAQKPASSESKSCKGAFLSESCRTADAEAPADARRAPRMARHLKAIEPIFAAAWHSNRPFRMSAPDGGARRRGLSAAFRMSAPMWTPEPFG
jgi:hypothetical protein